jgi:hypothetical protein
VKAGLSSLLSQFLSTFQEWHYFVGGLAVGFLLGAEYARQYHGKGAG